jgi:ParB family chromosome partitioning protein
MGKLSERVKTAGFNAGMNYYARMMKLSDIGEDPEIAGVFKVHDITLQSVVTSIKQNGFDAAEPPVLWKGRNIIVDGHTRVRAAVKAGLAEIPVIEKEFADITEAILYTFERQANRRNLEQSEIMSAAAALKDKIKDGSGRGAEILAKKLNVAVSTVYRARKICAEAGEDDLKAIQNGETTINKVYKKIKEKKRPPRTAGGPDGEFPFSRENVKFLKSAVTLLVGSGETAAAVLLVRHFLRKNETAEFYGLLPGSVRSGLSDTGEIKNDV